MLLIWNLALVVVASSLKVGGLAATAAVLATSDVMQYAVLSNQALFHS